MLYVTPDKYEHLYGVLERRKREVLETDRRIGNVYYTVVNDKYFCINIEIEVYIEEFDSAEQMNEFYAEGQLTLL
ncbi:hypothetical protein [Staphylococcus borealis]|uniref:hypothetical protein n=1 Tax=Staphylococcus borealis TaxID=2742203 RepID=UPI002A81BA90|nr:hypothetical protein [Staphylococcus borealis]MDY4023219.1 hypothetical protein [Staphylococcus borealis]